MKKVMLLLGVLFLVSCDVTEAETFKRFTSYDTQLILTQDSETGCKYIIYDGFKTGGFTPLLKSDGTPDCE